MTVRAMATGISATIPALAVEVFGEDHETVFQGEVFRVERHTFVPLRVLPRHPPGRSSERMIRPAANALRCRLLPFRAMFLLEIGLVVLSIAAFALFDLYARACDKI